MNPAGRGGVVESPVRNHTAFIWSIADLLRGDYKRSEYGKVILPLTVLRRLDGVLAPTREEVLEEYAALPGRITTMSGSTGSGGCYPAFREKALRSIPG